MGVISGIRTYHEAYSKLVEHYTSTFALRAEISRTLEALPKIHSQWDIKNMTENMIIVQEKYAILKENRMNEAFLESEFLSIVARKFPPEILKSSDRFA
ncbi:hypothetical protein BLA29_014947, partial [Euroglyphus maynei]